LTTAPILLADSIVKHYGSRTVLSAARLAAVPGTIIGLVGRNGTGKSTLLNIAAGLTAADNGTVRFGGVVYLRPRLWQLASRGLFLLRSDGSFLSPQRTVAEHLAGAVRQRRRMGVDEIVERFHLTELLNAKACILSGGERRRVEMAIAWLVGPRCLFADEPFREIDPMDRELFSGSFRELAARGCAIVVSGHEVPELFALADEIVWLDSGTTRVLGAPADARGDWAFRQGYLSRSEVSGE
jgi:ABC-type multidrug transport system ATPase subunit